jgi:hypothetical protein
VSRCPHCREELEPDRDYLRRLRHGPGLRRDCLPHRGRLLAALGTFSMVVGGLSLCLLGLGSVLAIPVGIAVWIMANQDLELMRSGEMDPAGRTQTENGRVGAIVGIILGALFAAFYALMFFRPLF